MEIFNPAAVKKAWYDRNNELIVSEDVTRVVNSGSDDSLIYIVDTAKKAIINEISFEWYCLNGYLAVGGEVSCELYNAADTLIKTWHLNAHDDGGVSGFRVIPLVFSPQIVITEGFYLRSLFSCGEVARTTDITRKYIINEFDA